MVMSTQSQIIPLYKPIGRTPLDTLAAFRKSDPAYANLAMSYAGRLDPAADGVLLALCGDAVLEQEFMSNADKAYDATVIFGIGTDSDDLLGIPHIAATNATLEPEDIAGALHSYVGPCTMSVPVYSSPRVQGRPLYWWARNKRLEEIAIPKRTTTIHSIGAISFDDIRLYDIAAAAEQIAAMVSGDFRQNEIIGAWRGLGHSETVLPAVKFSVSCSSGTYIRSLARELGTRFGTVSFLYQLTRTRVGDYALERAMRVTH